MKRVEEILRLSQVSIGGDFSSEAISDFSAEHTMRNDTVPFTWGVPFTGNCRDLGANSRGRAQRAAQPVRLASPPMLPRHADVGETGQSNGDDAVMPTVSSSQFWARFCQCQAKLISVPAAEKRLGLPSKFQNFTKFSITLNVSTHA